MNDDGKRQGPVARAAVTMALVAMLAAGVVLGGLVFTVLALSALTVRAARRLWPERGLERDIPARGGEVIQGSYVVLSEGCGESAGAARSAAGR